MVAQSNQSATQHINRLKFERMLPQILAEVQAAPLGVEPRQRRKIVAQTIEQAFAIFACLADRGMADIVYPKPLALAAVKQVAASTESARRERAQVIVHSF
jgi:hypothetical protein